MNKVLLLLLLFVAGCEIITIGKKAEPTIDINQQSPIGAVYLFKAELDSNNITAASRLMADSNGKKYLAEDKYEMYSEIARLKNTIFRKPITKTITDSLKPDSYKVKLELDYIKIISFTTKRIDNDWYIISYKE
jgi:hypothetical protein